MKPLKSEQAGTITRQADRIYQLELSVCEKGAEIKEQTTQIHKAIKDLEITLALASDHILEVDQAVEGMADFLDAVTAHQAESIQEVNDFAAHIKRAKKRLIDTQT
jgi:uncharacterized coiled-coil protein SlyX